MTNGVEVAKAGSIVGMICECSVSELPEISDQTTNTLLFVHVSAARAHGMLLP
jgi:hypothetical protein